MRGLFLGLMLSLLVGCGADGRVEGTEPGDCSDGADNDADGTFDCDDTGCAAAPACRSIDGGRTTDGGADAGGTDAGTDAGGLDAGSADAGDAAMGVLASATCGDPGTPLITSGVIQTIDTTGLGNDSGGCGTLANSGDDGFLRVEIAAGETWHFHVTTPSIDRDPIVYLLNSACSSAACAGVSNQCTAGGEEHFTFTAPLAGTYYLGIDDREPGGGVYRVGGYRLSCGDGDRIHGEACDETSASCSAECRAILSGATPAEREPNDNDVEANQVPLVSGVSLPLTGTLGGEYCTYPDVFTFIIDGGELFVDSLRSDGGACDDAALTPFSFELRAPNGTVVAHGATDGAGCARLSVTGLSVGRYFLYVLPSAPAETSVSYRISLYAA